MKIKFRDLNEVLNDTKLVHWMDTASREPVFYYFGLAKDSLAIQYYVECRGVYPVRVDSNKMTVFWTIVLDSKYDFNIVKAIRKFRKGQGLLSWKLP